MNDLSKRGAPRRTASLIRAVNGDYVAGSPPKPNAPTPRRFEFLVLDPPTPMGRKRFAAATEGGGHFYAEKKDLRSVYHIRKTFIEFFPEMNPMKVEEVPLITGAVVVGFRAWLKCPATMPMKRRRQAWMNPLAMKTKPDINNILNQIFDALTGYCYVDDKLVTGIGECWKFYAVDRDGRDTPPRMSITVEEL